MDDNINGSGELWRYLAPGVPRIHDWPHQVRGSRTTGITSGALVTVRREGNLYLDEAAIPRSELADLKFHPGTEFGFALRIGNKAHGGAKRILWS